MTNKNLLRSAMARMGISVKQMCDSIGMPLSSYYRKENGANEFLVSEINKISICLSLTTDEVMNIFFSEC